MANYTKCPACRPGDVDSYREGGNRIQHGVNCEWESRSDRDSGRIALGVDRRADLERRWFLDEFAGDWNELDHII